MSESCEQNPISPPAPAAEDASSLTVCPVCRTAVAEDSVQCMHCQSPHHRECWEYNRGCGTYGCPTAPPTDKLSDLEVPPSFWGQDQKECPVCRSLIQAAAMRCRTCGTVFSTSRPQAAGEFQQQRAVETELPKLRKQSIVLLVFSIIPCTSLLAAIFGGIWYAANRARLAALPAQQRAVPKIALGVAVIQNLILLIVLALYQALGGKP